jgi:hypothetical protein
MNKKEKLIIKRIPYADLGDDLRVEIDGFNEKNMGTIFHETVFNSVSARTFGTEFSYFIARKDGRLAGISPCHSTKDGLLVNTFSNLTSKDMVYGGWVYDSSLVSLDDLHRGMKIRWNEALHFSSNIELDPRIPSKPARLKRCKIAQTIILELVDTSEIEIFERFKHSQKNKIRKAEKMGVSIANVGPGGICDFYELLTELKENLNKAYDPKRYFNDIFSHYHLMGKAACFLARYQGQNISTLIILANKAYATIWMGGRKMGIPNNLYQNELMIWSAIKWARDYGSRYLDLCTVDEEKHPNLARIKLSFSKDVRFYYFYSKQHIIFRFVHQIMNKSYE